MNVFVIGNANSIWIKEYIKNIHYKLGNNVYLTDYYGVNNEDAVLYDSMNVQLVPLNSSNDIAKSMRMLAFAKEKKGKIDLVDLQSPPHSLQCYLVKWVLAILKCRLNVSFWGSDILRINDKDSKRLDVVLTSANRINIGTEHMCSVFRSFFGDRYDSRLTYAKYGSPAISAIDGCAGKEDQCRAFWGLDSNKTIVAIGHNGKKSQNHLPVIESFHAIEKKYLNQVELVLHIANVENKEYRSEIINALMSLGVKYTVIEEYYPVEEVAKLRKATDIFINAQTTDGLSGSMRECFYSGAIVFNPSWLDYPELDRLGVQYYKYDSFEDLPLALTDIIRGKLHSIDKQANAKIIYEYYSWAAVLPAWMEIINE